MKIIRFLILLLLFSCTKTIEIEKKEYFLGKEVFTKSYVAESAYIWSTDRTSDVLSVENKLKDTIDVLVTGKILIGNRNLSIKEWDEAYFDSETISKNFYIGDKIIVYIKYTKKDEINTE